MNWSEIFGKAYDNSDKYIRNANIIAGKIISIEPTKIKIENEMILDEDELYYMNRVAYLKNTKDENELNSVVAIIQARGGQDFYVIDKIGTSTNSMSIATIISASPLRIQLFDGTTVKEEMLIVSKTAEIAIQVGKKMIINRSNNEDIYYILDEVS